MMRVVFILLLLATLQMDAATINCADCEYSTVNTAVNATAARGDTVVVPAGVCSWSSALTITKGIYLLGAGGGATKVSRNTTMVIIDPDATAISNEEVISVRGMQFDGLGAALVFVSIDGAEATDSQPFKNLVIADNVFTNSSTVTADQGVILNNGQTRGLIGYNLFERCNVVLKNLGNNVIGDWSSGNFPFAFGGADNLFFERNTNRYSVSFSGADPGWIENGHGARIVDRYNHWDMANTDQNERMDIHGFQDWPDGQVGTMVAESYGNWTTNSSGYAMYNHRGSWGLFFNNISDGEAGMAIDMSQNSAGCTDDVTGAAGNFTTEVTNTYVFNNQHNGAIKNMQINVAGCGVAEDSHFRNYNASCTGSSCAAGVGRGTTAPTGTCTTGVAFWVASTATPTVDPAVIQNGILYKATATDTWTVYYQPYTFPHPLYAEGGGGEEPATNSTSARIVGAVHFSGKVVVR